MIVLFLISYFHYGVSVWEKEDPRRNDEGKSTTSQARNEVRAIGIVIAELFVGLRDFLYNTLNFKIISQDYFNHISLDLLQRNLYRNKLMCVSLAFFPVLKFMIVGLSQAVSDIVVAVGSESR